jgi:hypothetical protein
VKSSPRLPNCLLRKRSAGRHSPFPRRDRQLHRGAAGIAHSATTRPCPACRGGQCRTRTHADLCRSRTLGEDSGQHRRDIRADCQYRYWRFRSRSHDGGGGIASLQQGRAALGVRLERRRLPAGRCTSYGEAETHTMSLSIRRPSPGWKLALTPMQRGNGWRRNWAIRPFLRTLPRSR